MNYVVLSDVAKIIMGQSPPSSTYNTKGNGLPFFQGKADFGDIYPTPRIYCSEPNRIAEPGDILITVRAPVGPTNLNKERSCIGRGLSALRVGTNLDRNYLFYFLRYYEPELTKVGTGSTFTAISRENLETIKFPLPPLSEQKRISSILQKADRLRQLRRYARQLSDSYLQSVFLEMFGEPIINPKGWQTEKIGKFALLVSSGSTPLGGSKVYLSSGIRFIRSQNVLMNQLDFSDVVHIDKQINNNMNRTHVKKGDVLLNITGASIGRVAVYEDEIPANVNQHVCIIRCNSKNINPIFLSFYLSTKIFQEKILSEQSGATRQAFNFEQIRGFNIFIPPLELQKEFCEIYKIYSNLMKKQVEAERQSDQLFRGMLREAFE